MDEKKMETKEFVKTKLDNSVEWCKNHKSEILRILPVLINGTIEIIKVLVKKDNLREERRLKDNYIYDRNMGHYYELKHKPTSSEWIQIDQRKDEGEPLRCILQDMNVLK